MKKILIIDDEPSIIEIYSIALKAAKFLVVTAESGAGGLEKALAEKPDLILLDISMPDMDGFEMLEKLRQENEYGKKVPVILLTNLSAGGKEDFIEKVAKTGPMFYIVKSNFTPDKVIEKVKECLGLNYNIDV